MTTFAYSAEVTNNLRELNKLLELAESISESLERGNEMILRQTTYFVGVTAFVSFSLAVSIVLKDLIPRTDSLPIFFGILLLLITIIFITTIYYSFKSRNIRRNIDIDRRILGDLTDMISYLSSKVEGRISSVDYALITMRMRRISLSPDEHFFRRSS